MASLVDLDNFSSTLTAWLGKADGSTTGTGSIKTSGSINGGTMYENGVRVSTSDTKNTVGARETTESIYLVGVKAADKDESYGTSYVSGNSCYVTDGELYASEVYGRNGVYDDGDRCVYYAGGEENSSTLYLIGQTGRDVSRGMTYQSSDTCYVRDGHLFTWCSTVEASMYVGSTIASSRWKVNKDSSNNLVFTYGV